jgi:uncharacterized membrane protein YphA (DoxX/SURF4 family)
MKNSTYHIVRVGLGITFLWIGILIFRDPIAWGGFLRPWASDLLTVPLEQAMIGTAVLDFLIGFFLIVDYFTWIAATLGAVHLVIVLTVSGIDEVTVRDIGLLAAAIALIPASLPLSIKNRLLGKPVPKAM